MIALDKILRTGGEIPFNKMLIPIDKKTIIYDIFINNS
jgi:hypothetical protein